VRIKIIIIISIFAGFLQVSGQDNNKIEVFDRLVLLDGQILEGKIIFENKDQIKILIQDEEYIVSSDLIEKRAKILKSISSEVQQNIFKGFKENKISGDLLLYALVNNDHQGVGMQLMGHYLFTKSLSIGIGVGLDQYKSMYTEQIMPVTMEFQASFGRKKLIPYYSMGLGYGFAIKDKSEELSKAEGGYVINPVIGIKLRSDQIGFRLYTGLKFQKAYFESFETFGSGTINRKIVFKRILIGAAISF